ncbi:LysR substrate-binding domain-containing protein [Bordetella petrii]|uniref:LysR substrate-binding domain-containing protein n=1 Tax=Bordetella petrii TaxID=94624 RepID=UPI001E394802|nr:LysR substrate-binding domain-containing protein [Bordetella petrii]MCD0505376.1 LysR substrate-binding domain-containing protein [Bordetella petrii]
MELRHLFSFIVVAEEASFTRAARRLHIAQPPLSQRIRELEDEVGARLFERSTRKVALTSAGQAFLEHVRGLPRLIDDAVEASRRAQAGQTGKLRLGYTGRASQAQLPRLLSRLRQAYPDIMVDIQGPLPTGALRLMLLEDELDAALCFLPVQGPGLSTRVSLESELAMALPASHPYAQARRLHLRQLQAEPFVAYPSGQGFHLRQAMEVICRDAGFVPRVVRESAASQTLLCLIAAGVGVGLIPREIQALNVEGVVFRALPKSARRVQHGLAWRQDNANPVLGRLLELFEPG